MSDFTTEIQSRAREALRLLAEARAAADDYLVRVQLGDLESLARVAADHSVTLDGVEDLLSARRAEPA